MGSNCGLGCADTYTSCLHCLTTPLTISVKPVGALYEDLDGIEPVRTYETITEVNHNKQPVFEFFDELPALVPTIVANPPGQEGFESLYNKDGSIIVKYPGGFVGGGGGGGGLHMCNS